jgi:hypothetical protein
MRRSARPRRSRSVESCSRRQEVGEARPAAPGHPDPLRAERLNFQGEAFDGLRWGEFQSEGLVAATDRDLRQAGADVGSDSAAVLRGIHSLFRLVTFPDRVA